VPARIVIVGGGFAGAYCARALCRRLRPDEGGVTLIDRQNFLVFHPLLVEAGTGSLEPRHTVVPIRSFLGRTGEFRLGTATGLDLASRVLRYLPVGEAAERAVPFDHLVLALGSVPRLPPVPGLRDHGLTLKSLADAVALRDRAIELLERADAAEDEARRRALLHLVVVGGNYTGVEVAGEFLDLLRRAARRYRHVRPRDCGATLVELGERILPALGPGLSDYAARKLRARGVDVRLRTSVESVAPDHCVLTGGERIRTHSVIWCAGIAPPPLLASLDLARDTQGWLRTDADLRVPGVPGVWGIGDCATNPDPAGRPYPATAQHAIREGVHAARNIVRMLRGQPATPLIYRDQGSLAPLGCRTAVARVFGVNIAGFPAWFLWRTVYLLKMPGWARRARIAADWTLDLAFRPDYVQLGLHRAERP